MNDNALAKLTIQTLDDMERAARILAPAFNLTYEQALAIMLICQSDGIHPVRGIRLYDIIEGKPAPKATSILTWFLERGGKVEWIEYSEKRAAAHFSHPQHCPEPKLFELTIEEAQSRNLHQTWDYKAQRYKDKHNWRYHTAAMLRARIVTAAVRMIDPGAINGQHTADELEDASLRVAEVTEVRDGDQPPAARHERVRQLAEEGERRAAEKEQPPETKPTTPAAETKTAETAPEQKPKQAEPTPADLKASQQRQAEARQLFNEEGKAKSQPLFTPEEQTKINARKAEEASRVGQPPASQPAPKRARVDAGQPVAVQHLLEAGKELQKLIGDQACGAAVRRLNDKHECGFKKTPGKPDARALTLCPEDRRRAYLEDLEEEIRIAESEKQEVSLG